ncbi:MAG: hypothetical protein PETM_01277 [Petrimonas sp.]|uniref:SGNH/GDSL hydrolase family protein n=1 Tax=Petrimonas sp. TaxID=2023866 RepID=UPI0030D22BE9
MKKRKSYILVTLFVMCHALSAQMNSLKWWNPIQSEVLVVEGQVCPSKSSNTYNRLPERVKDDVREVVWTKSQESSGLAIRFKTNSSEIRIRYQVKNKFEFEHMPATGVSGLDLYSLEKNGSRRWAGATYTFGDTIHYSYSAIKPELREYILYLPLYNKVEWLNIGVVKDANFVPIKAREEQQIVVYGTSIAQGGCASRPGMAWTAQLGRALQSPVINLGFSSNGILEMPLIKLMAETDAKIFILDCLPNLTSFSEKIIKDKIINAVSYLHSKRPKTPILLAEHADANIDLLNSDLDNSFKKINKLMHDVFCEIKSKGFQNIYLLTSEDIGLDSESTVDGQHPNDLGMKRYALAYEKKIRGIWSGQIIKDQKIDIDSDSIKFSDWFGFKRRDFVFNGRDCILIKPHNSIDGNPWVWRTEFFGHEPQVDSTLLSKGFHLAYINMCDMYGAPASLDIMDSFYQYLVSIEHLNCKTVLEGFSRGGLFALNWAARNPDRVKCIYLDAPVCDFKSWPGGLGKSEKYPSDWMKLKSVYGFKNDKQAIEYKYNPVDNLAPLAGYKIPILSVCGASDSIVPMIENTSLLEKRYKMLGGEIKVISKMGVGHHPHSLKNPEPIVSFILEKVKLKF